MEHSPDDAPPLIAAPRHLRRRPFHAEIPDELLVPGVQPFIGGQEQVHDSSADKKAARRAELPMEVAYRRKRRVALLCVIIVSLSVPGLLIALIFAG